MSNRPPALPRLIVVPDDLWDAFEGTLNDCGITLVNVDNDRSFRAVPTLVFPST